MINFSDLKFIIIKNCKTVDNTDIGSRFGFTIDVEKLEKALNEKSDLHVIGFSPVIESRVPNITEIQPISEYVYKKIEIHTIFNGSTNIATFLLYCDKNGELKVKDSDNHEYTNEEITAALNNSEEEKADWIAKEIAINYPVYRVLIVRRFDKRKDKFTYDIYFRSNYNMITYIKSLDMNSIKNSSEETNENVEESTNTEETPVEEAQENNGE